MEVIPDGEPVSRLGGVFDSVKKFSAQALEYLPSNWTVWLIALTCLIVLVSISRIITLQKSVTELQSRPIVDETTVRIAVRQHLEETARAMEQHNKAHAMARQAEQQAREEQMRQMIIKQAQEQEAARQEQEARVEQERAEAARQEELRAEAVRQEELRKEDLRKEEDGKLQEQTKSDDEEDEKKEVVLETPKKEEVKNEHTTKKKSKSSSSSVTA
jgi:hypothetical protein